MFKIELLTDNKLIISPNQFKFVFLITFTITSNSCSTHIFPISAWIYSSVSKLLHNFEPMRSLFAILCFCLAASLSSQPSKINFSGKVKFISDAPLEMIKAESNHLTGIVDITNNKFAFSVKLKSFDGFNSALQKEHFHENYMESNKFPAISYTGKLLDKPDLSTDGEYEVRSKGSFNIHGITNERILKNKIKVQNGKVSIESSFNVLLADYNITIPRIVHKKIAEEIQISLTATGSSL